MLFQKYVKKPKNAEEVLAIVADVKKNGVVKTPAKPATENSEEKPAIMQTANIVQLADKVSEETNIEVKAGDLQNFLEVA